MSVQKYTPLLLSMIPCVLACAAAQTPMPSAAHLAELRADWLRQAALRDRPQTAISPEEDAAGGCDGVKNGKWGFHTAHEATPWWQVDLSAPHLLTKLRVFNRIDFAPRATRMLVLLSLDGRQFERVYQHDGSLFLGVRGGPPLVVPFTGHTARYIRLQLPGTDYFHLDEVEVYASGTSGNVALGKPATQSSVSQWSVRHGAPPPDALDPQAVIARGLAAARDLASKGVDVTSTVRQLNELMRQLAAPGQRATAERRREVFFAAHTAIRAVLFRNRLLDFDRILFVKRAPGTLPHMSDQYYGWWSRPGGGLCILEDAWSASPRVQCLTTGWHPGSFLRPELSYDGRRVLFAYARHYTHVAGMQKVDKAQLPEDAFYHLFELDLTTGESQQLTHGRYDDFDGRYLPDGRIVFLSTRKGQFLRTGLGSAQTTTVGTCPDSYVRCGGDAHRPCAVYTLHTLDVQQRALRAISAFENFEWFPSVASDGSVLYSRWDYIDRFNGHFMSLWSTNPDGTNAQLVYGNFTTRPQCVFEARSIPGSDKLIFTASAHHSITGGSLVLLDRSKGTEGERPLTRITPEVRFPETEGWDGMYYANPYPLSEDYFLVSWSDARLPPHHGSGQVKDARNPVNAAGIYLYDAFGNLELLHRDPAISSMNPIPLRPRPRPPRRAHSITDAATDEGRFLVQDVYQGLEGIPRGTVQRLRIVGVPPKTQPYMNSPRLGVSREDPGKFILGTVPVERDGSAYFRVPAGIPLFFQALDRDGFAVQTMRSLTYVQPGTTLSCIGCHEHRDAVPVVGPPPRATQRTPSPLTPEPEGTWPLEFSTLVQPVLDRHCTECHTSSKDTPPAAGVDLAPEVAYDVLIAYGDKDLAQRAFEKDVSRVGDSPARHSKLLRAIRDTTLHKDLRLDSDSLYRLITWMDVYAHFQGAFSDAQTAQLKALRKELTVLFDE